MLCQLCTLLVYSLGLYLITSYCIGFICGNLNFICVAIKPEEIWFSRGEWSQEIDLQCDQIATLCWCYCKSRIDRVFPLRMTNYVTMVRWYVIWSHLKACTWVYHCNWKRWSCKNCLKTSILHHNYQVVRPCILSISCCDWELLTRESIICEHISWRWCICACVQYWPCISAAVITSIAYNWCIPFVEMRVITNVPCYTFEDSGI